jgi:formate dehydrogenase beta subunit
VDISRRGFLRIAAAAGGTVLVTDGGEAHASGEPPRGGGFGALVDLSLCDGCRKCELACSQANTLPPPEKPFEDMKVLEAPRRPTDTALTVVNRYKVAGGERPIFVKVQCMHCNDPACASACIVGALTKEKNGAVVYDKDKCLGCRYCMVACPFQIPAYEYRDAFTPRVRKCTFCFDRISKEGGAPACAKMCPKEAIEFGPREEVLALARQRVAGNGTPYRRHGTYEPRIYGEKEVGGTGWVYVSPVPFEQLGFLSLPEGAPPRLTEAIQHGIFKNFIPPLAVYSLLGVVMHLFRERGEGAYPGAGDEGTDGR